MRRLPILFALALLLALLALAPASAGKPDCSVDDSHPSCKTDDPVADEEPFAGTMCDPAGYPDTPDGTKLEGVQDTDFAFVLEGKKPETCIDVLSEEGPWEVTVTGEGARYLVLVPRDSIAPGDSCGGWLLRNEANIYGASPHILGYDGSIPAATVNACGTQFGEWVDVGLPGLNPTLASDGGDCAAFSEDESMCLVTEQLQIPHPLVLQVAAQSGGGQSTFYVDLPPLDNSWPDLP